MANEIIGADPDTGALTGKVETWLNNTIGDISDARAGGPRVSILDHGAVDGAADNTTAMQAALAAGAGGTVVIPTGLWITDPLSVASDTTVLVYGLVQLRGQDVANLPTSHGVFYAYGSSGNELENVRLFAMQGGAVDGNARGMSNLSARTFDMEGINFKYVNNGVISGFDVFDTLESGIDLDHSTGCTITNNRVYSAYGYGIHLSSASTDNMISFNHVTDCGNGGERGGIDQYEGSSGNSNRNVYIGNTAVGNYRNYHIRGDVAGFDSSNVSLDGTEPDVISANVSTMLAKPAVRVPKTPLGVHSPTGGTTVDAEARTAINLIRAQLLSLGIIGDAESPTAPDVWDTFTRSTDPSPSGPGLGTSDSGHAWETTDAWYCDGSQAVQVPGGGIVRVAMGGIGNRNRRIEAVFNTSTRTLAGIGFRRTTGGDYLHLDIADTAGTNGIYLRKRESGSETQLAHFSGVEIVPSTAYALRVDVVGDTILGFLDEELVITYELTESEAEKYAAEPWTALFASRSVSWDDGGTTVDNFNVTFLD